MRWWRKAKGGGDAAWVCWGRSSGRSGHGRAGRRGAWTGIQFGAILIVGMAVGLVTPPVGMCLNVVSTITKLDIVTIFRASIPFLIADVIVLLLVTFVPAVSLWLPSLLIQ